MATDLSTLSDDDLARMIAAAQAGQQAPQAAPAAQPAAPAQPAPDLSQMSDADLHSAITAATPQMQGVAREVALPASGVAKGLMTALGTPGSIYRNVEGGIYNYGTRPLVNAVGRLFGANDLLAPYDPSKSPISIPTVQDVQNAGRNLGITDRPDLVPQNTREKYENWAAEGLGQTLPAVATGGVSTALPTIAQGVGANVGAEAAREAFPDHPIISSLIGALGGAKVGGSVGSTGQRVINASMGISNPTLDAYNRLGIDASLAGDVTGSTKLQKLQANAAKSAGGAAIVEDAGKKAVGDFSNAVDRTAADFGTSVSAQDAGSVAQREARNWLDNVFPARQQAAWAPVDQALSPVAAVRPDNYRAALSAISSKLSGLPATKGVLLSDRSKSLLDAINQDVPQGAAMSWPEAQALRSAIGEIRGVPEIAASVGDKQLARMYGALTDDMRTTAANYNAADAFDAANKVSTEGYAFRDNTLSKVIQSPNSIKEPIRPEQAADNLLNGGSTTLQAIRKEMPQAADELAAHKLRDMALANPGRAKAVGDTAPGTFNTDILKFRQNNPEGAAALFDTNPRAKQAVDDLTTVGGAMKETAARLNHSNTGASVEHSLGLMGGLTLGMEGYAQHGLPGAAAGFATGYAAPKVIGNLQGRAVSTSPVTRVMAAPVQQPSVPLSTLTRLQPVQNELSRELLGGRYDPNAQRQFDPSKSFP